LAIRVDGEYLGMGPGRRVPLPPGAHELTLGDNPPVTVKVTATLKCQVPLGKNVVCHGQGGTTSFVDSALDEAATAMVNVSL